MKCIFRIAVFLFLSGLSVNAGAEILLPGLISDGMVLQRDTSARIWGKAVPGKKLKVVTTWNNLSYQVVPDESGNWQVFVKTESAGGPYEISLTQNRENVTVKDVMLGEVWLCSGQSNMQMPVMGFKSQPVEGSFNALIDAPAHNNVRLFHVPKVANSSPKEDVDAKWERSSIGSVSVFSAVGYFFAVRLSASLGVPVGVIESDCGATRIESWMSGSGQNGGFDFFNSMIWPLRNFTLRGFLWYQGESNKGEHETYHHKMANLVSEWRHLFGGGLRMPFYYVMLAPFQYTNGYDNCNGIPGDIVAPLMWESQIRALDIIPNSDIAVTTDIGDAYMIHPPKKKEIADRLVMLAMHGTYGQSGRCDEGNEMSWRGPLFRSVSFEDGKAIVEFDTPGTLCPVRPLEDLPVEGFEIAGENRVFYKADAHILRNSPYAFTDKVVSSPQVPEPVAVRYAFHNVPSANLTNSLMLPAFPFRTDDWDDVQ